MSTNMIIAIVLAVLGALMILPTPPVIYLGLSWFLTGLILIAIGFGIAFFLFKKK